MARMLVFFSPLYSCEGSELDECGVGRESGLTVAQSAGVVLPHPPGHAHEGYDGHHYAARVLADGLRLGQAAVLNDEVGGVLDGRGLRDDLKRHLCACVDAGQQEQ